MGAWGESTQLKRVLRPGGETPGLGRPQMCVRVLALLLNLVSEHSFPSLTHFI